MLNTNHRGRVEPSRFLTKEEELSLKCNVDILYLTKQSTIYYLYVTKQKGEWISLIKEVKASQVAIKEYCYYDPQSYNIRYRLLINSEVVPYTHTHAQLLDNTYFTDLSQQFYYYSQQQLKEVLHKGLQAYLGEVKETLQIGVQLFKDITDVNNLKQLTSVLSKISNKDE